jgi:predicted acetyltransferase
VAGAVALEIATPDTAAVLSDLLELYMRELSAVLPVTVGPDGRFRYGNLPLYWSEPATRFPFLIRAGPELAGVALATRGSPASEDPTAYDVAEFFVLPGLRRTGVGRQAAFLLWDRFPGRWVVRVSEANRAGLPFWDAAVRQYTDGAFSQLERPGKPHGWRVFTFRSPSGGATR